MWVLVIGRWSSLCINPKHVRVIFLLIFLILEILWPLTVSALFGSLLLIMIILLPFQPFITGKNSENVWINIIMTTYEFIQINKKKQWLFSSINQLIIVWYNNNKNSSPTENCFSLSSRLFPEEKRNDSINLTILLAVMMPEKVWRTER